MTGSRPRSLTDTRHSIRPVIRFVKERGRQVSVADPTRGALAARGMPLLAPPRVLDERRLVSWIVTVTPRGVLAMPGLVTGLGGRCRTAHRVCRVSPRASHEARRRL